MKITVDGDAKEIAALVLAIQERQDSIGGDVLVDGKKLAQHIKSGIQENLG